MSAGSPKRAFDLFIERFRLFIERFRLAIQCVADSGAFGTGHEVGPIHAVTLTPRGGASGDPVALRAHDGRRDLHLQLVFSYRIDQVPAPNRSTKFEVATASYSYLVLDGQQRELLAYHWHPGGVSPYRSPHLHVAATPTVHLAERGVGTGPRRSVAFGRMHLPTGMVSLEDVVELLFTEFGVAARRPDWQNVLSQNRALHST